MSPLIEVSPVAVGSTTFGGGGGWYGIYFRWLLKALYPTGAGSADAARGRWYTAAGARYAYCAAVG